MYAIVATQDSKGVIRPGSTVLAEIVVPGEDMAGDPVYSQYVNADLEHTLIVQKLAEYENLGEEPFPLFRIWRPHSEAAFAEGALQAEEARIIEGEQVERVVGGLRYLLRNSSGPYGSPLLDETMQTRLDILYQTAINGE